MPPSSPFCLTSSLLIETHDLLQNLMVQAKEKELDGLGTGPVCRLVVVPESAVRVNGRKPRPRKIILRMIR